MKIEDLKNKIICGNCLDILRNMPLDNSFFFSDPPYNQNYHYDIYKDNLSNQEYRNLLFNIFAKRKSIIIHYPEETINILTTLDLGKCEQVVSWVYPSNTAKQMRLITWWNCKPNMKKDGQEYKNPTDKRIKEKIKNGEKARLYDWWEINQVKNVSKKNNNHSCPIPSELAERVIKISTNEGDTIIDPFCGSGTICSAAKKLERNYVGIDISPNYCSIAEKRLKSMQDKLF